MNHETLVEMQIEDGQKLVNRLVEEGVPVNAAFWAKESPSGEWFLYLVTPLVGDDGARRPAYRRVNAVIRQIPAPFWIHPLQVKVVGAKNPIAQDVLAVQQRVGGPRACPTWWGGTKLGELSIEGAYFYPLPTSAPR